MRTWSPRVGVASRLVSGVALSQVARSDHEDLAPGPCDPDHGQGIADEGLGSRWVGADEMIFVLKLEKILRLVQSAL
ncbi:unnamed protein product [Lampetra planeri]